MRAAESRALVTSVTVFVEESTPWRTWALNTPGRVVLLADCGTTGVSVHLDRAGIKHMQAALADALATLEKAAALSAA